MNTKQRAFVTYLVAAAKAGEQYALNRLAAQWFPVLHRHAYRMLGAADGVDDIAQEAWLDVQGSISSLRDVNAFPAWSLRIVSRRVAKEIKRRIAERQTRSPPLEELSHNSEWGELSSLPEGEAQVLKSQVTAAMANLSPVHKATLALFYNQDMSVAEIAVAMDVPQGTVKSRLAKARVAMRHLLDIKED